MMPSTWRNRRIGEAKLKLKEMGSRYLLVILYVWLEKYFSRGDYRKHVSHLPVTRSTARAGTVERQTAGSAGCEIDLSAVPVAGLLAPARV